MSESEERDLASIILQLFSLPCKNRFLEKEKNMKTRNVSLLVMLFFLAATNPIIANTLDVGIGEGFSYNTVQDAINAASNGDTVIVHPGTYTGSINFLSKNIVLKSTNPQNADIRNTTILNPSIVSTIQGNGPYINGSDGTITGFTINGGIAFGNNVNSISYSPKVSNCNILSNYWGVVGLVGYMQKAPTPIFENNIIKSSNGIYMFVQAFGYGMNPIIRNNTIIGISPSQYTAGILFRTDREMPTIENNIISNFETGIYFTYAPNFDQRISLIRNNDVYGNTTNCYRYENNLIYDLTGINGNISDSPLFSNFANDDYQLTAGSPCIDAGMNTGCYTNIEGNLRPYYTGLNPNGFLPGYDIGAYEFIPEPATLLLLGFGVGFVAKRRR